ncbi:hypothetical protein T484DRAFT_1806462, partial [Baffinella frigidus]
VAIPPVPVVHRTLSCALRAPPSARQGTAFRLEGTAFRLELELDSASARSIDLVAETQPSEAFLLAGYRCVAMRLDPRTKTRLAFNLVPVGIGSLAPPAILLKWKADDKELQQLVSAPPVFVLPPTYD